MILFPAITITDSTPFTFKRNITEQVVGTVKHLIAWVDSGSSPVFCGNEPGPAQVFSLVTIVAATKFLQPRLAPNITSVLPHGFCRRFKLGDVFTCATSANDDGNFIVGIDDNRLEFRNVFADSYDVDVEMTLTPAAVSATNGLPINEGTERQWTSDRDVDFLSSPIKFVVDTGTTATLRLAYEI